jgi:predicted NBD/HSP70 family sugar kinase
LRPSPHAATAIGVDISREGVSLCFLDLGMQPIFEKNWSADVPRERVLAEITATVQGAASAQRFLGVGVVSPGPVDAPNGKIEAPDRLDAWHHFCVSELGERLALPVVLKKDTTALAVAEKPNVGPESSFLVLLADHGLGGGFIYQGRLFESDRGLGCEVGHISLDVNGPICACGNRGCAELYASIPSVLSRAEKELKRAVTWAEFLSMAEEEDSLCRTLLYEQADALAAVCVGSVNVLEPRRIVLEGKLYDAHPMIFERMEDTIRRRCFTQSGKSVRVLPSSLSQNARAIAAGNLILEHFFEGDWYDHFRNV